MSTAGLTELDRHRLAEALADAQHAVGLSEPNPRVGCVIGTEDGVVIGHGHTQQAGGPHAEVMALRDATAQGHQVSGATAWVTLEPCAHHGRTPPCCDALIAAGISRVVASIGDPHPNVAGRGFERLRAAGVTVVIADGESADEAKELNIGFFHRVAHGRPWVRVKVAISLDGRTALLNRQSQWITGEAARADGHFWRRRAGALLTGIGTALADDPQLNVRLVPTSQQPLRALLDSRLRLRPDARLLDAPGTLVYCATAADPLAKAKLQERGAAVVPLKGSAQGIDLNALMADLAAREVNELHVEAGATLNAALLQADLVDELLIYVAPVLLGKGTPLARLPGIDHVDHGLRLKIHEATAIGGDLRLRLRRLETLGKA